MDVVIPVVTVLAASAAGMAISYLVQDQRALKERLTQAERQIEAMLAAQARHLPYSTAEEIENSLAALWRVRGEIEFRAELLDNAISHMQKARGGNKKR